MNSRDTRRRSTVPRLPGVVLLMILVVSAAGRPIQLLDENPHYLEWRGEPTVLITSGEHYGAVLNRAFDYRRYLKALESYDFNLTRTFTGAYCEPPGAFNIQHNTLAPAGGELICPWARSEEPGYANGGNRFDLTKWNPAYFRRLRDFLSQANKHGVVVELVLFCPFYKDSMWDLSPMNAANNVNGVGTCEREEAYTLKHASLQAVQDRMVRKIVRELQDFDNLYYEICNEPYFGGVTLEWQAHIAEVIAQAEEGFEHKHLIAQNIANKYAKIEDPNPLVSIFNFHYAKPEAAMDNYGLNRVLGDDETGFRGSDPTPYRLEGWRFMLAGGAVYSNLDYSFTVGHEDGSAKNKAPGSVGSAMHKQLQILGGFLRGFDFWKMKPSQSAIERISPKASHVQVLADTGRAYAIHVSGAAKTELHLRLPAGEYGVEWLDTKTGSVVESKNIKHEGGSRSFRSPAYEDDIALRILQGRQASSQTKGRS